MATTGTLSATNFVPIEPHQTIETEIDIAELYDVETTDTYVVRATGAMPYADINSTTLTGDSVAFSSNALTLDIDGDMAKATPYAIDAHHNLTLARRTELSTSGCSSSDSDAIAAALRIAVGVVALVLVGWPFLWKLGRQAVEFEHVAFEVGSGHRCS